MWILWISFKMDITQWLNKFSDEENYENDVDDDFNDPDFYMPNLRNVDNFGEERNQSSDEDSVEPVSEEENNDPSNNSQQNVFRFKSIALRSSYWES